MSAIMSLVCCSKYSIDRTDEGICVPFSLITERRCLSQSPKVSWLVTVFVIEFVQLVTRDLSSGICWSPSPKLSTLPLRDLSCWLDGTSCREGTCDVT